MTFIHIVLLKVKSDIWVNGNGKDELIQKLDGLKEVRGAEFPIAVRCICSNG